MGMASSGAPNDAHAVLSAEVLAGLDQETGLVRGLPNAAFTSEEFLALERDTLFKRSWVFAGRVGQVAKRGDVEPIEVAGRRLFLARGADDRVRVFHNVCPHRGARLVIEPVRETSVLTCPYHAWSFDLEGRLRGRPHYHGPDQHDRGNGANPSDCAVCLFEVRSAVWHDWVFVNLDGAAQDFEAYREPLSAHFDGWDLSQFRYADHEKLTLRCNWKLAVENSADYYHNFKVHTNTVDPGYVRAESGPYQSCGIHLSAVAVMTGPSRFFSAVASQSGLPTLSELSLDQALKQPMAVLFPNTFVIAQSSMLVLLYYEPIGLDETVMHMWYYFVGDGADAPEHERSRKLTYADFDAANKEDEGICLRMQEGRTCDAYDGGRLSPYWDSCTAHFQRQVVDAILGRGVFARPA